MVRSLNLILSRTWNISITPAAVATRPKIHLSFLKNTKLLTIFQVTAQLAALTS